MRGIALPRRRCPCPPAPRRAARSAPPPHALRRRLSCTGSAAEPPDREASRRRASASSPRSLPASRPTARPRQPPRGRPSRSPQRREVPPTRAGLRLPGARARSGPAELQLPAEVVCGPRVCRPLRVPDPVWCARAQCRLRRGLRSLPTSERGVRCC